MIRSLCWHSLLEGHRAEQAGWLEVVITVVDEVGYAHADRVGTGQQGLADVKDIRTPKPRAD